MKFDSRNQATTRGSLSRRRMLGATAGLGAAATLAACGTKKGAATSNGSPAAQAGRPKLGGTLNVSIPADYFDYDASLGGKSPPNSHIIYAAYDRLVSLREGPGVDYNQTILQPALAEKWETPDAQNFTFHLRKGVQFADVAPVSGRALTSDDVKWSYEYWSRTGDFAAKKLTPGQFQYVFEGLDRIETPDPSTVVVRFKQPFAPFLNYSTSYGASIVPHEIYDADGSLSKRIAGTGPFQLDLNSSQHGSRWVVKKNPNYWDKGKPYLDQINYLVLPDDATIFAAFQAKQLDIIPEPGGGKLDPKVADQIKKNNPDAVVQNYVAAISQSLFISYRHPPFDDVRMRKAFSLAIDRDQFDKTFAAGRGGWVMCMASVPDDFTQDQIKQVLKYDPEQAKQLVVQAGYPNGVSAELLKHGEGDLPTAQAELLQSQTKAVGINLTIKDIEAATWSKRLHAGDFDITRGGSALDGDQDALIINYYSTSSNNYVGVKDPQLDSLIDAERREPDPAKRKDRIRDVLRYMGQNAVSVSLFRPIGTTFWQPYLKNFNDNWQDHDYNAANIWLDK